MRTEGWADYLSIVGGVESPHYPFRGDSKAAPTRKWHLISDLLTPEDASLNNCNNPRFFIQSTTSLLTTLYA